MVRQMIKRARQRQAQDPVRGDPYQYAQPGGMRAGGWGGMPVMGMGGIGMGMPLLGGLAGGKPCASSDSA
jgi:hypothetical protein